MTILDYLSQSHLRRVVLSTVGSLLGQLEQCNSAARVKRKPGLTTFQHSARMPPFSCCCEVSCRRLLGCDTSLPFSHQEVCSAFPTSLLSWKPSGSCRVRIATTDNFPFRKVLTLSFLMHNLLSFPMMLIYFLV